MIGENRVQELHTFYHNQVKYTNLQDHQFQSFINSLSDFAHITEASFLGALSNYFDKRWKDNQYYSVETHIIQKLTIQQLEALGKKNSSVKSDRNFIGTLFKKIHHDKLDPERIADLTFEQRREEMLEMYNSAKDHPQSFKTALLHEILEFGIKLDTYDKDLFLEYLKHP